MKDSSSFTKDDTLILKGIAIIFMMFHHSLLSSDMYAGFDVSFFPFTEYAINIFSWFGKSCVGIFACLSGYGLCRSFQNRKSTVPDWTMSHIVSTFSDYWFVFLISNIGCFLLNKAPYYVYFSNGKVQGVLYWLLDFFGLSGLWGTPSLNGSWWYMSAALVFVLVCPLTIYTVEKCGCIPAILFAILVPRALGVGFAGNNGIWSFYIAFLSGVCFAKSSIFEKVSACKKNLIFYVVLIIGLIALIKIFITLPVEQYWEIEYGITAGYLVFASKYLVNGIPALNTILRVIGKHSTNIFLVHIFVRVNYLCKFIYSFKNWILIIAALLTVSILISLVINHLKKISHYDVVIKKVICTIESGKIHSCS